jgi:hypothetical protein
MSYKAYEYYGKAFKYLNIAGGLQHVVKSYRFIRKAGLS